MLLATSNHSAEIVWNKSFDKALVLEADANIDMAIVMPMTYFEEGMRAVREQCLDWDLIY